MKHAHAHYNLILRYACVLRLLFLIKDLYLIGVWLGEVQRTNILKTYVYRYWTRSSNSINYLTLNSEHTWEDLCFYLRNQQTCTSTNHNWIKRAPIFNPIFMILNHRFAYATQLQRRMTNKKNELNYTNIPWKIMHMSCF